MPVITDYMAVYTMSDQVVSTYDQLYPNRRRGSLAAHMLVFKLR